jgi:hypothetical protein
MVIDMNDEQLSTLADLQGFLDGTVTMDFMVASEERYAFIARTVKRFGYLFFTRTTWQGRIDTDLLTLLPTDERRPALETARKALSAQGERQLVLLVSAGKNDAGTPKAAALLRRTLREFVPDLQAQNDFAAFYTFPGDFYAGFDNRRRPRLAQDRHAGNGACPRPESALRALPGQQRALDLRPFRLLRQLAAKSG